MGRDAGPRWMETVSRCSRSSRRPRPQWHGSGYGCRLAAAAAERAVLPQDVSANALATDCRQIHRGFSNAQMFQGTDVSGV